jgi:hypothetical protein
LINDFLDDSAGILHLQVRSYFFSNPHASGSLFSQCSLFLCSF